MTRDELLLAALAAGNASTAVLGRSTGLTERTCRYGLAHLVKTGYVWSPGRGRWRLTDAGEAIAATLLDLPAGDPIEAETEELRAAASGAPTVIDHAARARAEPPEQQRQWVLQRLPRAEDRWGMPGWLGWLGWGLAALSLGAIALAYGAGRPQAAEPEASPPLTSDGWPYNGLQNWRP